MVNNRGCAKECYQLERSPCTEHLGLVDGTLHNRGVALYLVDNQISFVDDAIETRIETLNHTVVGAEGVLVEFLHFGIVAARTATSPDIVRQAVLGHKPVVVKAAHLQIE